ncbi:MAG: OsmC family protein [Candidatus Lokiarchaeota archaeon]|nr:OsmC family protein [Candidatus Lokiarchaeota archaeon]
MKVTINYSENMHFIAKARNFNNIHIDEPESFHGTGLGPSPVEYTLIGIGGCLGSTFSYCLSKKGIEISDLKVIVDGKMKHEEPDGRLRLIKIEAELQLTTKNNENIKHIDECSNTFLEYCIVSNSIARGVPIDVNVVKNELLKKKKD